MNIELPESLQDHPEVAKAYLAYLSRKQASNDEGLRIAACGVYNAGKSSLLNVLANQFEIGSEAFKTGAARETSKVSELRLTDVTLIDMPGIDGARNDDEAAWQGVLGGDCYLYVHRLKSSEFEQSELEFLHLLKEKIRGLEQRLVLVISQIDEVADADEIARREASIRKVFAEAIGFEPKWVFPVSVNRFKRGTQENKQGLVRASGIVELQDWVNKMGLTLTQSQWETFRSDRFKTERDALASQIMAIADSLDADVQNSNAQMDRQVHAFEKAAKDLVKNIKQSLKSIDSKE